MFLPKFHFVFVQAMKNFLPDQWWFLMHTNNMERRLNETEFLEKVKKLTGSNSNNNKNMEKRPIYFFPGRGRFANIC